MIVDNNQFERKHKPTSYSTITHKHLVFSFYNNKPLKRMKRGCWSHTDEFIPLLDVDEHL